MMIARVPFASTLPSFPSTSYSCSILSTKAAGGCFKTRTLGREGSSSSELLQLEATSASGENRGTFTVSQSHILAARPAGSLGSS